MSKTLCLIALLGFMMCISAEPLKFKDGKFRIMQITDTHFADSDEKDANTSALLNKLLAYEKPDLAIVTGDLVSGIVLFFRILYSSVGYQWNKTKGWYKHYWELATQPFIDNKIYYALTLGNHDSEVFPFLLRGSV